MNCPYCEEPVNYGATVCKTCHRDIALVNSLNEANNALEEKVQALEAELHELRDLGAPERVRNVREHTVPSLRVLDLIVVYLVLPIVLLVVTHYLLVVKFDTNLAWLRTASIVIPAIFGWMLQSRFQKQWFVAAGLGVAVGLAAVFGMSTVVHFVDGDAIMPVGRVVWQETLEYVTSIALAYMLGALIAVVAGSFRAAAKPGRNSRITKLATFIALQISAKSKGRPMDERVHRIVKLISLAASASTAAGTIYTGFKGIL